MSYNLIQFEYIKVELVLKISHQTASPGPINGANGAF